MVYVFLADGVAEMEAVTATEILRRAGVETNTVGVTGMTVTGARGMKLPADLSIDAAAGGAEMLVLPGGSTGVENLAASERVKELVCAAVAAGLPLGAICAAPKMLSEWGLLKERTVTCHPSVAEDVKRGGAYVLDCPWVREGSLVTGQGPGASSVFGLALVSLLRGREAASRLAGQMLIDWH